MRPPGRVSFRRARSDRPVPGVPRVNGRDLTAGPVSAHLLRLTLPMVVGVFAVISVGLADAYFVGRLGDTELAAISFIFPVTTALTSLGIGLSAGANALVSQALGAGRPEAARCTAAHAILFSLALGIVAAVAGYRLIDPPFALLNAQPDVLPAIASYLEVWYYGFPLLVILLVTNALMRAHGAALAPASIMVLNAVFNIGLNPVLIFGWGPIPALGIAGASTATLCAFAISLLASAWPVLKTFAVVRPGDFASPGLLASIRRIGGIGGPAAFANAINPAGLAIVTSVVAGFGAATVAGFGAAGRIQSFALVPLLGLSGSIGALIGQNWGAGETGRAGRALVLASAFCLGYGLLAAVVLNLFAGSIARQFSDEPAVHAQTVLYLRIVAWTFFGYGLLIVANACLNARSRSLPSMLLSLLRIAGLYVPLAWLGARLFEQAGVYAAAAAANVVAGLAALVVARRYGLLSPSTPRS